MNEIERTEPEFTGGNKDGAREKKTALGVLVMAAIVVTFAITSCGSGSQSSSSDSSSSLIDAELNASVKCKITSGWYEYPGQQTVLRVAASEIFYFDYEVTVTNYDPDDAHEVYIEFQTIDLKGIVFESQNWLEVVTAGRTLTMTENRIAKATSELEFELDGSFDCAVVKATFS